MKNLRAELRLLFAEWLLRRCLDLLPIDERAELEGAAADYFAASERAGRWEKFPA